MSFVERILQDDYQIALGILAILSGAAIVLIKWVPKIPVLKKISFVPFLFFVPMLFSNFGLIPVKYGLYQPLQSLILYLAIFFMVATIDVRNIVKAAEPKILLLFVCACMGTVLGAVVAWAAFVPIVGKETAAQVSAGATGMYCGGSMNWVAVCDALRVPPSLNAAAFPAVVMIFSLYLSVILILEGLPAGRRLQRWLTTERTGTPSDDAFVQQKALPLTIFDYILALFAFCSVYLAAITLEQAFSQYVFIPQVIFLTTFALVLGTCTSFNKLRGLSTLGEAALYFLLCVIGAQGNLIETLRQAPILLLLPLIIAAVHGIVVLFFARAMKIDLATTCVTSISCIGGAASAPIVAAVFKREALIPIGVLLGSLGYAVGNYLGIYLGYFLIEF